ncbi:hypothetical protein M0R45_008762 [Rubus argutus]|uniref:Uncharacterized protein n=1 Tax=Rubus argutus TaxID=59490 RepID=A0AAW1Y2P9_RUBAR
MKSMIASQMQRMGKDIRIIKSRLPTRKSANQGRGGRMKRADYLATEVDTGKEKSTCDGDPSQQMQVGHKHTYGWDIDEDYSHHRNDLSHLHINDKTKSAQDHDVAEYAEIRKQGSSAIMAKFRSPDQETLKISGDHQFTLDEGFGLVSLNRRSNCWLRKIMHRVTG